MSLHLIQGFLAGLRPDPILTVSQWADRNRVLSSISASEPGQWRTSRTPYLKEIMDCLSTYSSYKKVVVMKGAQLGLTEAGNNWIGYIIDNSPAPTLMVQPTDDTVKRNSKMRIDPMIQACSSLHNKVSKQKSRSGENTITQKNFPGGMLLMAGSNSPVGLRSVPIKNLFLDEVDGYPYNLDGEGSPIELAIARTRTFAKKKIFIISTPTVKDASAIEREFNQTDRNYYEVPCPHCGTYQILTFDNLKWEENKPETAQMLCETCGSLIEERHKTEMLNKGKWTATAPEKSNKETIGFHISSLYSPFGWFSWADIAAFYERSKKEPTEMITFVNTILGETYEENGEAPKWEEIYNKSRTENNKQNKIPANVCFLTCGVDIQKDRIELEVVGWCYDKQSYSIDFRVLIGNTTLPEVWEELAKVISETWIREDGIEMTLSRTAIDTGYNTTEVHSFCRKYSSSKVIPIKGQDALGIPVSPPRQIDYNRNGEKIGRLKQWNIGVSLLKSELYSWLMIEPNTDGTYPPNYCHFPQYDDKYFRGLTAEQYLPKTRKWKKTYERNEPLDCRIYARAAANIVGIDRMKPEQLKKLGGISETHSQKGKKKERKKRESFWDN